MKVGDWTLRWTLDTNLVIVYTWTFSVAIWASRHWGGLLGVSIVLSQLATAYILTIQYRCFDCRETRSEHSVLNRLLSLFMSWSESKSSPIFIESSETMPIIGQKILTIFIPFITILVLVYDIDVINEISFPFLDHLMLCIGQIRISAHVSCLAH